MSLRRVILGLVAAAAIAIPATIVTVGGAGPAAAETPPVYLLKGVAVGGYDPVAYFTDKKPMKGNPAIALDHEGAKYFFASEEHRELFKKEPDKYLPQYGGYCAWAVSHGSTAKIDPTAWTVHDGKLFLNYDKSVKVSWDKNLARHIAKADANWPKIVGVEKASARAPATPPKEPVVEKEASKETVKETMMPAAMKDEAKDKEAMAPAAMKDEAKAAEPATKEMMQPPIEADKK